MSCNDLEQKNIILQQRIFDMKWLILKSIELIEKGNIEKGNIEKALKILKRVEYEK